MAPRRRRASGAPRGRRRWRPRRPGATVRVPRHCAAASSAHPTAAAAASATRKVPGRAATPVSASGGAASPVRPRQAASSTGRALFGVGHPASQPATVQLSERRPNPRALPGASRSPCCSSPRPQSFVVRSILRRRDLGTPAERATFTTLHTASLAAPHLREGLTPTGARRAVRHLRALLDARAVALVASDTCSPGTAVARPRTSGTPPGTPPRSLRTGRTMVLEAADIACPDETCAVRGAVAVPVTEEDRVVAALAAYGADTTAGLARATEEVAALGLHPGRAGRARPASDPARWRPSCAPCARRSARTSSTTASPPSRRSSAPTPSAPASCCSSSPTSPGTPSAGAARSPRCAEELRNVERYLVLEQARFGDRLRVSLLIAPEVLPVAVPYLAVQPLVENAVRHGLEGKDGRRPHHHHRRRTRAPRPRSASRTTASARTPRRSARVLGRRSDGDTLGLGNVDARLRQVVRRRLRARRRDRARAPAPR